MRIRLIIIFSILVIGRVPAQNIYGGAGLMSGYQSQASWFSDSINIITENLYTKKYLVPVLEAEWRLNEKFQLVTAISYRRHTISLALWDNRADTCSICPLKKGGGPTFNELRLTARLQKTLYRGKVSFSGFAGAGSRILLARQTNYSDLPYPYSILQETSGSLKGNAFYLTAGGVVQWQRLLFRLSIEYTSSYTSTINISGAIVAFQSSETLISYSLMYRVTGRKKKKESDRRFR